MSEKLLCHELVVDAWITETIQYDLSIFDWNMNFSQSPTTFQLFLQGLKPATWLTGGYVMTKKKEYFTFSESAKVLLLAKLTKVLLRLLLKKVTKDCRRCDIFGWWIIISEEIF